MTALANLHFLRPAWLLLLLALPMLWWIWRSSRADAGAWRGAVDAHLLPYLLERGESRGGAGVWLAAAIWLILVTALAGPAWDREPQVLYHNDAARVLALELGPSMLSQDIKPSRLERARFKLDDILTRSADMQTALIAYAGDAFVAAPLTDDANTVRNLVDSLAPDTMPVPGNATSRAIEKALDLIHQAGLERGQLVILADSAGDDAVSAARKAHAQGLDISVLGIGSSNGAPVPLAGGGFLKDASGNIVIPHLDESALRALATAGGGRYARLTADGSDLDALLIDQGEIGTDAKPKHNGGQGDQAKGTRWRDRGPWLLLLALPLALVAFRRGWLMVLALALIVPAPRAQAFSLTDLWLRSDQQAAAALAADDAKKASTVARTPEWRGAADYRNGDYASAEKAFAAGQGGTNQEGANAAYNRGNALAKLDKYQDALAAYDEALKLQPDMADASANKAAVEAWLKQKKQQQKNQDQQKQGGKKSSGKQDSSKSQSGQSGQSNSGANKDQSKSSDSGQQKPSDDSNQNTDGEQGKQDQSDHKDGDKQNPSKSDDDKGNQQDDKSSDQPSASSGDKSEQEPQDNQANAGQAGQQKPSDEQQKALSQAVDKALNKPGDKGDKPVNAKALSPAERASQEKQQALEQWLQRVPDDPGGLLRRKFMLEYQQRQRNGGDGE